MEIHGKGKSRLPTTQPNSPPVSVLGLGLVNDLLRPLARFSLIRIDGARETYGTHRMVQEVLRYAMDDAERRLWAERAVRAMNRAFPIAEHANWPLCKTVPPPRPCRCPLDSAGPNEV